MGGQLGRIPSIPGYLVFVWGDKSEILGILVFQALCL